jgi:hypothetical protein
MQISDFRITRDWHSLAQLHYQGKSLNIQFHNEFIKFALHLIKRIGQMRHKKNLSKNTKATTCVEDDTSSQPKTLPDDRIRCESNQSRNSVRAVMSRSDIRSFSPYDYLQVYSPYDCQTRSPLSRQHYIMPPNQTQFCYGTNYFSFSSLCCNQKRQGSRKTDISIMVGNPSLCIHRIRLPSELLHILDQIVMSCEGYASTRPSGWITELYSLTKQDIALKEIPHMYEASKPIVSFIIDCMKHLWGIERISLDKNQPHILKYDDNHKGVELHHDKCDLTANLCLSRKTDYVGGG